MKKIASIAAALLAAASLCAASMISQPAATVNLIRNEVITMDQLDEQVARLEAAGAQNVNPLDALQTLINDRVFLQGAERDGVVITDSQLSSNYNQVYNNAVQQAAQYGQTLTREDFDAEVIRQFGSMDAYMDALRNQAIMQTYLYQEKGTEIQNSITANAEEVNAEKKAAIEAISADIKSGATTFEASVPLSEDAASVPNGGEIGWLAYNDAGARQGFGDAFCDAVLAMQPGQVSDVLESNVGYHIVKVSVHNPAKILTLDDNIAPDQNVTVRQFISQLLTERQMQVASSQALQDMVEELRSEARINILYNGTAN